MNDDRFSLAEKTLQKHSTDSVSDGFEELFCKLHDSEYLGSHTGDSHACLGCTLNESLYKIYRFLKETESKEDVEYVFTVYILLSYLLIEKLTVVFKVIGITQNYVQEKWPVLIEFRKWANFVKHPKGFLFSHHAIYHIEGIKIPQEYSNYQHVNYKHVESLYNHEDERRFEQTMKQLANKPDLLVVIPDPLRLTNELITTCNEFCEKIRTNSHFQEILKKHSVLENYYQ